MSSTMQLEKPVTKILTQAEWNRVQVIMLDRIHLLETFIAEIKVKPPGTRDSRKLKSLEADLDLTSETLKLLCA